LRQSPPVSLKPRVLFQILRGVLIAIDDSAALSVSTHVHPVGKAEALLVPFDLAAPRTPLCRRVVSICDDDVAAV